MDERLSVCPGDTIQYVCSVSPPWPANSISWIVQCAPPGRPCGIDMQAHLTALQNRTRNDTVCGNVSIFVSGLEKLPSQARSNVTFHIPHSPQTSKLCLWCQGVQSTISSVAGIIHPTYIIICIATILWHLFVVRLFSGMRSNNLSCETIVLPNMYWSNYSMLRPVARHF